MLAALFALPGCRATIRAEGTRPSAVIGEDGRPPAAAFFRWPVISQLALSPDGLHIAGVSSRDGRENLIVRSVAAGRPRALLKLQRRTGRESWRVHSIGWASNDRILVGIEMPSKNSIRVNARQTRLIAVPLDGGAPRYLGEDWPYQEYSQGQDDVVSWLPEEPDHVLVNLWLPGDLGAGVRRLNVHNGRLNTVVRPQAGTLSWFADHRGSVRVGWGRTRGSTEVFLSARVRPDDRFEEIIRFDPYAEPGFSFAAFSEQPQTLYVFSRETGRQGIYTYDLVEREMGPLLFAHPEVDLERLYRSKQDRLLAIGYVTDRPRLHFVDEQAKRQQAAVDAALPDRTNRFISSSRSESRSIVWSSGDVHPPSYYLFDRKKAELVFLWHAYPELRDVELAAMRPIQYAARDGLTIHGYLTIPPGAGERPLPTIVYPHGGPWARDVWGWDSVVQFLASRGFAVLQPNFRGSDGYGLAFEKRGYGAWGEAMQDDITDGARWLVEQGIADPERIGIYGASYGGFAALQALISEPEVFRAGASFAGVTDVPTLLFDDTAYFGLIEVMEKLVGERRNDRIRLEKISPARHADEIRAPVLIGHGTEDPRIHVKQAYRMVDALEEAGVEFESHIYQGAVHGFVDERNEIDFYEKLAAFFERHLMADPPRAARTPD